LKTRKIIKSIEPSVITENLVLHDEEGERSFCLYWVRNLRGCSSLQKKSSSISIACRAMSSAGWGSSKPPNQQMKAKGKKPQLNGGSLVLQDGVAHIRSCVKLYSLLNV